MNISQKTQITDHKNTYKITEQGNFFNKEYTRFRYVKYGQGTSSSHTSICKQNITVTTRAEEREWSSNLLHKHTIHEGGERERERETG